MNDRALVVEDDAAIADAVAYALRAEAFEVDVRTDGETALAAARTKPFDVVLLDIRLPGVSGLEVCRRLRAESDVPIIMLTARDAEVDRVLGLESGADDYVTKPFSMPELLSRVRAILRRRQLDRAGGIAVRAIGALEVDLTRHEVRVEGRPVHLTPTEFKLLALLAGEPERVFGRSEIMKHLWQSEHVGDARACDIHVSNLRGKLETDPGQPERIVTVRGAGYKLVPV
jgi:two-component system response regulator RegX3